MVKKTSGEKGHPYNKKKKVPPLHAAAAMVPPILAAPWLFYAIMQPDPELGEAPTRVAALCLPPFGEKGDAKPIAAVEVQSRVYTSEDDTTYASFYRLSLYDPETGEVLERKRIDYDLPDGTEESPSCLGYFDDMLLVKTTEHGYHLRNAEDLSIERKEDELLGSIKATFDRVFVDEFSKQLIIPAKDGRTYRMSEDGEVDASDEGKAWHPGGLVVSALYGNMVFRSLSSKTDKTSKGTISTEGQRRRMIFHDGVLLAETDWLSPQFLFNPRTKTLEWSKPASIIVCEQRDLESGKTDLTRVSLEGKILWSYRPEAKPAADGNDCPWGATSDGNTLLMVTDPPGLVGIDAETGEELFRRAL